MWQFFPLAEGTCGVCEGNDCGNIGSIEVVCEDDVATLYQYEGTGCSGTLFNETTTEASDCSASGTCSTIEFNIAEYVGSEDCSGDSNFEATLYLAPLDNECLDFGSFYAGMTVNEDGLTLLIYLDDECAANVYGSFNITEGCEVDGSDNSTEYSFSDGSDSGGSGSGSSDANTFSTFIGLSVMIGSVLAVLKQ